MEQLSPSAIRWARASVVALWCLTAAISIVQMNGRGAALLAAGGVPATWYHAVIVSGAVLDLVVGLAMWRWHYPVVYQFAAACLLVMTITATVLLPSLWLDPLGSLTKNLPITALLWILYRDSQR